MSQPSPIAPVSSDLGYTIGTLVTKFDMLLEGSNRIEKALADLTSTVSDHKIELTDLRHAVATLRTDFEALKAEKKAVAPFRISLVGAGAGLMAIVLGLVTLGKHLGVGL